MRKLHFFLQLTKTLTFLFLSLFFFFFFSFFANAYSLYQRKRNHGVNNEAFPVG